jgi:hypothetical protein
MIDIYKNRYSFVVGVLFLSYGDNINMKKKLLKRISCCSFDYSWENSWTKSSTLRRVYIWFLLRTPSANFFFFSCSSKIRSSTVSYTFGLDSWEREKEREGEN